MFDDRLEAVLGDRHALADLAGRCETQTRRWGCRKLLLAAAWADAHSTVDHPAGGVLVERLVKIGPAGTPAVAEFAPQGLVGPFGTSVQSARSWMGDALTVRHRLPRLWERVQAGEVHAWQARQIATLTAHLNVAVAGVVDEQTTGWVGQLPWASFLKVLDATMLEVDEKTYREREKMVAAKREVRATQSEDGLRTLIARGEAGDVAMLLALHQRVAECLADEGDEDPLPVRMSKAMGWIANPARVLDLLARHAGDPDPYREPWEKIAAHQADDTDPWADDLPAAGWETAEHGNYHQPAFDEDEWWTQPRPDTPDAEQECWPADPPPDPDDLAWYHHHTDDTTRQHDEARQHDGPDGHDAGSDNDAGSADPGGTSTADHDTGVTVGGGNTTTRRSNRRDWTGQTASSDRDARPDHAQPSPGQSRPARSPGAGDAADADSCIGSVHDETTDRKTDTNNSHPDQANATDSDSQQTTAPTSPYQSQSSEVRQRWPEAFRPPGWKPLTRTELAACAPTLVMHVHLTDQTLRDGHGIVRTPSGPILLEQLQRFLLQHDAHVTVYPVVDPADTAAADAYEAPLRLRRAMQIRNPRSVFPHSPTTSRTDLDHTPAYQTSGPPGQTGMHTLGPLARSEHRAKTVGKWKSKQPEPGTYLWRSPEGWIMITTNQGTLTLGHTQWATHLWNTTAEPSA